MKKIENANAGFSLIELILVIAVFSILFSASTVVFGNLISRTSLGSEGEKVVQALREARTYAVTQRLDSSWGVYLDTLSSPQGFIIFKGLNYAGRDTSYDQVSAFSAPVVFGAVNLGATEIVFAKRTGLASSSGNFGLTADGAILTVTVNPLGFIDYVSPAF